MRIQRTHNREGTFPDVFGPPKSGWGVGPRRALQFCSSGLVWQAKQAVAEKKAAEDAEKVPFLPRTGCIRSPSHCERHALIR
jgi:hypothetical protein